MAANQWWNLLRHHHRKRGDNRRNVQGHRAVNVNNPHDNNSANRAAYPNDTPSVRGGTFQGNLTMTAGLIAGGNYAYGVQTLDAATIANLGTMAAQTALIGTNGADSQYAGRTIDHCQQAGRHGKQSPCRQWHRKC